MISTDELNNNPDQTTQNGNSINYTKTDAISGYAYMLASMTMPADFDLTFLIPDPAVANFGLLTMVTDIQVTPSFLTPGQTMMTQIIGVEGAVVNNNAVVQFTNTAFNQATIKAGDSIRMRRQGTQLFLAINDTVLDATPVDFAKYPILNFYLLHYQNYDKSNKPAPLSVKRICKGRDLVIAQTIVANLYDTFVTGTATTNATLHLSVSNGAAYTGTAQSDGTYKIELNAPAGLGETYTITATDADNRNAQASVTLGKYAVLSSDIAGTTPTYAASNGDFTFSNPAAGPNNRYFTTVITLNNINTLSLTVPPAAESFDYLFALTNDSDVRDPTASQRLILELIRANAASAGDGMLVVNDNANNGCQLNAGDIIRLEFLNSQVAIYQNNVLIQPTVSYTETNLWITSKYENIIGYTQNPPHDLSITIT